MTVVWVITEALSSVMSHFIVKTLNRFLNQVQQLKGRGQASDAPGEAAEVLSEEKLTELEIQCQLANTKLIFLYFLGAKNNNLRIAICLKRKLRKQ